MSTSSSTGGLAELVGGRLVGRGDVEIRGVNTLADAREGDLAPVQSASYLPRWITSRASAGLVEESLHERLPPDGRPLILVPSVEVAMVALLERFAVPAEPPAPGVDPSASVDASAEVHETAHLGPFVSVGAGARIGAGVVLHAGVRIYPRVEIGEGTVIHANTVVRTDCRIGRRVILHNGVSIGADGFGYVPRPDGAGLMKVPHAGNVVVEDEVEIGANSCVDRGKFGATVIGAGTKIDNLVQIGHNCRIGRSCVIAGVTALAGSVEVADGVRIAGQVGIADHRKIGRGATIAGGSGVMSDVPEGETWFGYPARPALRSLREAAALRKLPGLIRRIAPPSGGRE